MDDGARVRRGEPLGDLRADVDGGAPLDDVVRQPRAQRLPFEQLRDDEEGAVLVAVVEDGEDVRVRQRRDRARLALEARQRVGVTRGVGKEDFDGDVAAQARIAAAVDRTHPSFAEQRKDLVGTDAGTLSKHCRAVSF